MRWLELLFDGFAKMFFARPRRPLKSVAQAVHSDWRKIGKDFRKVLNGYGR